MHARRHTRGHTHTRDVCMHARAHTHTICLYNLEYTYMHTYVHGHTEQVSAAPATVECTFRGADKLLELKKALELKEQQAKASTPDSKI
jgi:hypothetical protein